MASLNKVQLIGRLGQDPELRITSNGNSVANVSIATTEYYKQQEKTEWHRLVFWNKLADLVGKYCRKGSQIYVEGSLQTSEWQDKDGNKRYKTEIIVRNLQFLDSKPEISNPSTPPTQEYDSSQPTQEQEYDDVPF